MSWERNPLNFDKKLSQDDRAKEAEYFSRSRQGPDMLTVAEQDEFRRFGYFALQEKRNEYIAMKIFLALHDFQGLREVIRSFQTRKERNPLDYSSDYISTLLALEDYEAIREEYNTRTTPEALGEYANPAYAEIDAMMRERISKTLHDQKTPVATGSSRGILDLVGIHHLAKTYDVAIPIARGGLIQGAVAKFWGMQTFPLNISAHDKKIARARWVQKPDQDELAEKRVLLFDKDAISGATMRKALEILQPYAPADVTACFTWSIVPDDTPKGDIGTRTGGIPEEITPTSIRESPCDHAGDILIKAHERLGTPLGNRRVVERAYRTEFLPELRLVAPRLAQELETFITNVLKAYDSLNQLLPGISEHRKTMIDRLIRIEKDLRDAIAIGFDHMPGMESRYIQILRSTSVEGSGLETQLHRSRYVERSASCAKLRGVDNSHSPSEPLAAHKKAVECARDSIDMAIIVGPEGFAFEPYFQDMNIPTVAVNIPESDPTGKRTFKSFDDLRIIEGKVIVIVEDDVRTGATLQKLLKKYNHTSPEKSDFSSDSPHDSSFKKIFREKLQKPILPKKIPTPKHNAHISETFLRSEGSRSIKTNRNHSHERVVLYRWGVGAPPMEHLQ